MRTAGLNYTDYIDSCRLVDQRFCEFVRFVDALLTMYESHISHWQVYFCNCRTFCSVTFLSSIEKLYRPTLVKISGVESKIYGAIFTPYCNFKSFELLSLW